jgi:hypothetical protein
MLAYAVVCNRWLCPQPALVSSCNRASIMRHVLATIRGGSVLRSHTTGIGCRAQLTLRNAARIPTERMRSMADHRCCTLQVGTYFSSHRSSCIHRHGEFTNGCHQSLAGSPRRMRLCACHPELAHQQCEVARLVRWLMITGQRLPAPAGCYGRLSL